MFQSILNYLTTIYSMFQAVAAFFSGLFSGETTQTVIPSVDELINGAMSEE